MRFIDAIRDIVLMIRPDGQIVAANKAALAAYGYSWDELRAMRVTDLRAPGFTDSVADQMDRANAVGILFETVHHRKNGSTFPVEVSSQGMDLPTGRVLLSVVRDTSERKQAETALRQSEQLLQRALASLRDAVFVIDASSVEVLACNPAVSEIFGYAPEEVIGHTTTFLHVDESALEEFRRQLYPAIAEKGYLHLAEFSMRRKDGSVFPTEHTVMPLENESGKPVRWVSVVRDITERKRIEGQLRESEEKYRSLYQSMSEGVVLHEVVYGEHGNAVDYRILDVNPAFERTIGLSAQKVIGELASKVYGTGEAPYLDIYARVAETGEPFAFETTFDPMQKSFAISVFSPARGRFATVFSDISERKRAEADRERFTRQIEELARLAQHRAREIEIAVRSMADAVFICDTEGAITLANEAALRLIGSRDLSEGGTLASYLEGLRLRFRDGSPIVKDALAISRALQGETVRQQSEVGFHPVTGTEIDLLVSASPIRDEEASIVGAVEVARDVTELMELDRLKEQFINVAAHELKTPVAVMKGFAQLLLRRDQTLTAEQRGVLERIDQGANRIDGIVQAILDVSLFNSDQVVLSLETIDLAGFVSQQVNGVALVNPKHRYRLVRADHVAVQADTQRLGQVVQTLLDNASRYSPNGGEIEVEVEAVDGRARVSVRDHGVGIPEKKQVRIFQRFYRAHTGTAYDYGGLGVGLFIARSIVVLHGGEMDFVSEEGVGSNFRFTLPIVGDAAEK